MVKTLKPCVFNWADMEQFGVRHLTGEPDALNLRALFDLTEEGRALVLGFLNMPEDTQLRPAINAGAVASIALPRSILNDLAVVAYVKAGSKVVVIQPEPASYVMAVPEGADTSSLDGYINKTPGIKVIRV